MRTVLIFTLIIAILIMAYVYPVNAAGDEEIEDCIAIGKANQIVVYRCEDWEMGNTCYIYGGFLMCVQD